MHSRQPDAASQPHTGQAFKLSRDQKLDLTYALIAMKVICKFTFLKTKSLFLLNYSVVSLGKTLYGAFLCLVVLASSSKLQTYLY